MEQQMDNKDLVIGFLSKVPPFSALNRERLSHVASITTVETHKGGHKLFSYGDSGDRLYIIVEGKVRVGREVSGIGEEAFAILGEGDYFGELSLIDEGPRSADAIIHERCTLLSISHGDFEELLMLNQQLAYEILWEFCRTLAIRLRETDDKLAMLQMASRF
jgi:CRP/FNR family cyclic AMP-dependent transcriptional regulator